MVDMTTEEKLELADREFRRILNDTPHVLYKHLNKGDIVIDIVTPQKVTMVCKKYVRLSGGTKLWKYWTYSTVNLISAQDADFIKANWEAYRIWLLHGLEGLRKAVNHE